ncbi:hypothetical protein E2562_014626 [Oryza meyeriana var. granulata]|uniref:Uncharacterized protein n=1 Tax=Oryza meyeriana var. granulata TaxID=110450 RepID=A0A6G1D284_9ORYZ|nr:hypothetical protein E2562_014626 [Oryza meyeriana var. granulata]
MPGEVVDMLPNRDDAVNVLCTHLDFVCFTRKIEPLCLKVLNPATGATLALPKSHSNEIATERGVTYHEFKTVV